MRSEIIERISATELARHVAQTIDNVRINRNSLLITRGAKVVAKLSPPPKNGLSVRGLISLLKSLPKLTPSDTLSMKNDISKVRAEAKLPENQWG